MQTLRGAIEKTVSISQFNRGLAGKIFDDVKATGAKVVIKNNAAECVLLSPKEYISLLDEVNDARLLTLASVRMTHFDASKLVSQEALDQKYGFTPEDLAGEDEVELE